MATPEIDWYEQYRSQAIPPPQELSGLPEPGTLAWRRLEFGKWLFQHGWISDNPAIQRRAMAE